jgi:hypothetical protein
MNTKELPKNIHELLNSCDWQYFIESRLGNDLFIDDPERADRILNAAEDGCDGSTHAEHIQDWRDFTDELRREALGDAEDDESEKTVESWHDAITAEIDACEKWHEDNGTLEQSGS